jgi:hypothetical protein
MTRSSLNNENDQEIDNDEDIEGIEDNEEDDIPTPSPQREFKPFAAELHDMITIITQHWDSTNVFLDSLQRWVRVHREHDGGDLSEIYDRVYGGTRYYLPGQPPAFHLTMAVIFEGGIKKLFRNGDPLLLPEWIDRLNETVEWKW